jgi:hypothetical protein
MRTALQENCDNTLLTWEKIEQDTTNGKHTYRAKVPGGWIVRLISSNSHPQDVDHMFIADKGHTWGVEIDEKK